MNKRILASVEVVRSEAGVINLMCNVEGERVLLLVSDQLADQLSVQLGMLLTDAEIRRTKRAPARVSPARKASQIERTDSDHFADLLEIFESEGVNPARPKSQIERTDSDPFADLLEIDESEEASHD